MANREQKSRGTARAKERQNRETPAPNVVSENQGSNASEIHVPITKEIKKNHKNKHGGLISGKRTSGHLRGTCVLSTTIRKGCFVRIIKKYAFTHRKKKLHHKKKKEVMNDTGNCSPVVLHLSRQPLESRNEGRDKRREKTKQRGRARSTSTPDLAGAASPSRLVNASRRQGDDILDLSHHENAREHVLQLLPRDWLGRVPYGTVGCHHRFRC